MQVEAKVTSEEKAKKQEYKRRWYVKHQEELRAKALARYYLKQEENKKKARERYTTNKTRFMELLQIMASNQVTPA